MVIVLFRLEKLGCGEVQSGGKPFDVLEAYVPLHALNRADISPMKAGYFR
jgi:hypothetical protein